MRGHIWMWERSYRSPWCRGPGLAALQTEQAVSELRHLVIGMVSQGNPSVPPPPASCSPRSRWEDAGQQAPNFIQRSAKPLYIAPSLEDDIMIICFTRHRKNVC